jgi:2-polyprenyl-3-methyl-5-hydroxy-6-metoxy-1,4-benzoquinol methylase
MNKFRHRTIVAEIIDDFNMQGQAMEQNLEEIEWINKNLGGTQTSAYPILMHLQKNLGKELRVADIGCGSGDVLKYLQTAISNRAKVDLTGVDANQHIIEFARKKHFLNLKVNFIHADIIHHPEQIPPADVYMLNLFLHHFEMTDIKAIIKNLILHKPSMIVINDLERSRISYLLFALLCYFKNASFVTFNDGRLSILKGFARSEMICMAGNEREYSYNLRWRWAFRWQLVLTRK